MEIALVTKHMSKDNKVMLYLPFTYSKSRLTSCMYFTNKTKCFSKSGGAMWVLKNVKEDWPIVLQ